MKVGSESTKPCGLLIIAAQALHVHNLRHANTTKGGQQMYAYCSQLAAQIEKSNLPAS